MGGNLVGSLGRLCCAEWSDLCGRAPGRALLTDVRFCMMSVHSVQG